MRVLIAIDHTEASYACVVYVAQYPWPADTQIGLLAVLEPEMLGNGVHDAELKKKLVEAGQVLNRVFPGQVVGADCVEGKPAEQIVFMAEQWQADLIVVGAHTKTPLERLLLGSVSQSVLEHSPCSVLIVRGTAQSALKGSHKLLVAIDGSSMANWAAAWVGSHDWPDDAQVCFVSVMPPMSRGFSTTHVQKAADELAERADLEGKIGTLMRDTVSQYAPTLSRNAISIHPLSGKPDEEIVRFAQLERADLIVLGSHGRMGIERLLLGSVSQAVASRASCSVLVIKSPPGHEAAEGTKYTARTSTEHAEDHGHSEMVHRVFFPH